MVPCWCWLRRRSDEQWKDLASFAQRHLDPTLRMWHSFLTYLVLTSSLMLPFPLGLGICHDTKAESSVVSLKSSCIMWRQLGPTPLFWLATTWNSCNDMLWSASEITSQKADLIQMGEQNNNRWLLVEKPSALSGPMDMTFLQRLTSLNIKGRGSLQ